MILPFSSFANIFTHMVNGQFTTLHPHPFTPSIFSVTVHSAWSSSTHAVCAYALQACFYAWLSAKPCLVVAHAAYVLQCVASAWLLAKPCLVNARSVYVRVVSLFLLVVSLF